MKKQFKKFYIGLAVPLLLCGAYFAAAATLLKNGGEYLTMRETADKIDESYGLYGSALSQRTFYFKKELYLKKKPAIAALGSSRVLQFRGESFSAPFVNIGGMSGLDEADELVRATFETHAPDLVLFGVDFWWFHPANETARSPRSPEDAGINITDLLTPAGWLASGKMTLHDVQTVMRGDTPDAGFAAILRKDGFDRAGAYYYTSTWNGARETDDRQFKSSLDKIESGSGIFIHGEDISQKQMQKLVDLIEYMESKGAKVILFLPPLAPAINDAMDRNGGYAYVRKANGVIADFATQRHLPLYDFHELRVVGSGDCEFTDGIHGGQIAYDRILLHMAGGDAEVRGAVKLPETGAEISTRAGHASMLPDETDFLGIGCQK